jgi:hypothetical protein
MIHGIAMTARERRIIAVASVYSKDEAGLGPTGQTCWRA